MSRSLPARPSLRQLQIQAKELARDLNQSHPEALGRLRRHHPHHLKPAEDAIPEGGFQLHEAQLVIAREYGFESLAETAGAPRPCDPAPSRRGG